jgi:hypothetical protein
MAVELFVTKIMKNVYDKNDDPRAPEETATYTSNGDAKMQSLKNI